MLEVCGLQYAVRGKWGKKTDFALRQVDFSIEDGYMTGVLEKNGSGKSTLLRLLYGMRRPDAGTVRWNGTEVAANTAAVRQEIAFADAESGFFRSVPIEDNVELFSSLYPAVRQELWEEYLERFALHGEIGRRTIEDFSVGQRKLLWLAFVLARTPRLLLLDEPTDGLDPVLRVELMQLLQEQIEKNCMSVVISTHITADIERTADYLCLLERGCMKAFGEREDICEHCDVGFMERGNAG